MVVVSWDIVELNTALDGLKYLFHFHYDNETSHHIKCTKIMVEAATYFKICFPKAEK